MMIDILNLYDWISQIVELVLILFVPSIMYTLATMLNSLKRNNVRNNVVYIQE